MKCVLFLLAVFLMFAGCDAVEEESFDLREIKFESYLLEWEAPPDSVTGAVVSTKKIAYQRAISGPQYLQDSINQHVQHVILCKRLYCDDDASYENFIPGLAADSSGKKSSVFYFSAHNTVMEQREKVLSFETRLSIYAGGASGNGTGSKHYTHIMLDGSQVKIEQLVSDVDELFRIGKENFLKPIPDGVYEDRFFIPPDWYILKNPNGSSVLVFYYQTYDVAPGVRGPVVYRIPKDLIKHIVIEEYWP